MALTLQTSPDGGLSRRKTDHFVMSGGLCIGRIYKRESVRSEAQWLWALNGISAPPEVMRSAGMSASFESAEAALKENWAKWLAWANLQEVSYPRLPPRSEPLPPPAPSQSETAVAQGEIQDEQVPT
jgi:hypothetical protein